MTRNELNLWANNDSAFWSNVSINEMEKLVATFPYFAPAQLVLAKQYHINGDHKSDGQTQLASLYAIDRPKLFELIYHQNNANPITELQVKESPKEIITVLKIEEPNLQIQRVGNDLIEELSPITLFSPKANEKSEEANEISIATKVNEEELVDSKKAQPISEQNEIQTDELKKEAFSQSDAGSISETKSLTDAQKTQPNQRLDFYAWLDVLNKNNSTPNQAVKTLPEVKKVEKADFDPFEIIDRFIANNPRIASASKIKKPTTIPKQTVKTEELPKKEFYSPENMAQKSLVDEHEIVSETLAHLYVQQGNIQKAKKAYEKLQLIKPEKSTYFAALIEKLNQQS